MKANLLEVGKVLRAIRYDRDLSHQQIAEDLRCGLSSVNHWMNDDRSPYPRRFQQILDIYGYKMLINGTEVRYETFFNWIREESKKLDIPLKEISERSGFNENYISRGRSLDGFSFMAMQSFVDAIGYQIEIVKVTENERL